MMHGYPEDGPPEEERESDPILRPYRELELYGSLYISSIAIYEKIAGTESEPSSCELAFSACDGDRVPAMSA